MRPKAIITFARANCKKCCCKSLGECTPSNDIIKHTDYPTGSCQSPDGYEWSHSTCGDTRVCKQGSCKLVDADLTSYTLPSGKIARSDTIGISYTIKNVGDTQWCFLTEAGTTKSDSNNIWPNKFNSISSGSSTSDSLSYSISCSDPLGTWSGSLYTYTDLSKYEGWKVWGTPTYSIQVVECLNDADCTNCLGSGYTCDSTTNKCKTSTSYKTYFKCSFSKEYPPDKEYYEDWTMNEPVDYPCEKGKWGWINTRGGSLQLVHDPKDSSRACLKSIFDEAPYENHHNAKIYELMKYSIANRQDYTNWNVEPYITKKEVYFSFKIWFPSNLKTVNWRQIWQFCGPEGWASKGDTNPHSSITWHGDGWLYFTVDNYYTGSSSRSFKLISLSDMPKEQWVEFVIYWKFGSGFKKPDGKVKIWMNGKLLLDRSDIQTNEYKDEPFVTWGIGNYGSGEEPLNSFYLYKDVMASSGIAGYS